MTTPHKIITAILYWVAAAISFSATLYVDNDASNDPGPDNPAVSDPLEDGSLNHPFDAIQKAVNAAQNADTILLAEGTYTGPGNRDIDFLGKAITVQSENGPETCIIDCQGTELNRRRGFIFQSGETLESILSDITIMNGYAPTKLIEPQGIEVSQDGGGIYCVNSSPVIRNCRFFNNRAALDYIQAGLICHSGTGGAIACEYSDVLLQNCIFENNYSSGGGAVSGFQSTIEITNCLFVNNHADLHGRALNTIDSYCTVKYCTFYENSNVSGWPHSAIAATTFDGIEPCTVDIHNSILWEAKAVWNDDDSIIEVTYSNIKGGYPGEGNVDEYPRFVDPGFWEDRDLHSHEDDIWHPGTDYRLLNRTWIWDYFQMEWVYYDQNPCVDGGSTSMPWPAYDLGGTPRPIDGKADGQAVPDMGAYEFDPNDMRIAVDKNRIRFQIRKDYKAPIINGISGISTGENLLIHTGSQQTLRWAIVDVPDWLNVSPVNGVSFADANTVSVTFDIDTLEPALYSGSFTIIDTENPAKQKTVSVELLLKSPDLLVPANYATIQEAIDWAQEDETVIVADGIYTGYGNRNLDFRYKDLTVESQNGPENCIIDCQGSWGNSQRAFIFDYSGYFGTHDIVLSGFKIINGFCNTSDGGGAILCDSISPTINNCIFENCFSEEQGGAIACNNASPTIENCTFLNCYTYGEGGAVACTKAVPIIKHTRFEGNKANAGSAVSNIQGSLRMENCTLINNKTIDYISVSGGAVFQQSYYNISEIRNCLFEGNTGRYSGAFLNGNGTVNFDHCTFAGNRSDEQYNASFTFLYLGDDPSCGVSTLNNCIFTDNQNGYGSDVYDGNAHHFCCGGYISANAYEIHYSCFDFLDPDLPGFGNIQADPMFVGDGHWDGDTWVPGDYHLKSAGWRWDVAAEKQWTWDDVTSPCIDAGNPGMTLGDESMPEDIDPENLRGENIRINMGAYGGTAQASIAPPGCALLCDLDNSGCVDLADLPPMAAAWLHAGHALPADVTRNGTVDLEDVAQLAAQWLDNADRPSP